MKISIITATRNNCYTLERAILSYINQKYDNKEYIVVEAPSSDCTGEVLNNYASYIDRRIVDEGKGIYYALNAGIKAASGDIIGLLHADDFYADEDILSDVARLFAQGADMVYGDVVYVLPNGKIWRYWRAGEFNKRKLRFGWMPPHTTLFVRKELFDRLGYYRTDMRIAADFDMVLRFMKATDRVAYLPRVITIMSAGGESNRSFANIILKMREDARAARDNGYNGWITVLFKNLRKIGQLRTVGFMQKKS